MTTYDNLWQLLITYTCKLCKLSSSQDLVVGLVTFRTDEQYSNDRKHGDAEELRHAQHDVDHDPGDWAWPDHQVTNKRPVCWSRDHPPPITREQKPEARREKASARDKQWVFQGKVQGSVIFRQYYPEGGWGCVILLVGVIMVILTSGIQLSLGMLVRPATWKFKPSLLSYVSLSGFSLSVSMALSPLVVAFCKVSNCINLEVIVLQSSLEKVNSSYCGGWRSDHLSGLPVHLVRHPVSPDLHQLRPPDGRRLFNDPEQLHAHAWPVFQEEAGAGGGRGGQWPGGRDPGHV